MMSSPDGTSEASPRACGVGADLRAARERLGWSLPAIAAHLRIRLPFLEAIEDGRIGDLPGNAYALGFVRTYAQSLGLDPDEIARRFRAEAAEVNRKTELTFPAPVPERGVPAGAVVLLGAVLVVGAYAGWYHMSDSRPSTETVQPVPERLAPLAATVPPTPVPATPAPATAPSPAPAAPATAAPPAPAAEPAEAIMAPPAISPGSAAASIPATGGDIAPTAAATLPATPAGSRPAGSRIMLRASADAWLEVRDKSGTVLLNRVLHRGETWPVPDQDGLLLTTGNAGGTQVLLDGVATAALGASGAVRHDLPLDPDLIRDGKLAALPAPRPPPLPQSPPQP
jgi:cytoskeleton protein RodZ